MIPTYQEIRTALQGALGLARGDVSAMEQFDFTFDGFWKSFFAAVLVLPLYFIVLYDHYAQEPENLGVARIVFVEGISYVLGWLLFPILAIFITRLLDRSSSYVPLIVVSNWGSVPQAILFVLAILFGSFFPPQTPFIGFMMLAAFLATLAYQWFLIRVSLQVSGFIALAVLFFYLLVNYSLKLTGDRFLYAGTG